jgi:hypothetical protein
MKSGYGRPNVRFWRGVNKDGPIHPVHGQCWVWTLGLFENGYGAFWVGDRQKRAHRYSWEVHVGPIPKGKRILHRCDNPCCVNPKHLFVGTDADNIADMVAKGRHPHGETHGSVTKPEARPRGEGHGMAKLTDEDVREIRRLYRWRSKEFGTYGLANRYNVTQHLIVLILQGKIWTHV